MELKIHSKELELLGDEIPKNGFSFSLYRFTHSII